MLDLSVEHVLKNSIAAYKANRSLFDELFESPVQLPAELLDAWWAELQEVEPLVRLGFWARQATQLPVLSVQLVESTPDEMFLGNVIGAKADGRRVYGLLEDEVVQVTVSAQTSGLLRALTQIARAGLISLALDVEKSGYDELSYEGMDTLALEELLVAENLDMRVRRMSFSAKSKIEAPELQTTSGGLIDISVAATPFGDVTPYID